METVFIVTRTCYGEDYSDPTTSIEIFGTEAKALKRFKAIIKEESEYTDNKELRDDVEDTKDGKYLDYTDYDSDYRVVVTLEEREVK